MTIDSFSGSFRFLSNFYPSVVSLDGRDYPTVEHAFAAAKTTDAFLRDEIRRAYSPGAAKKLGRTVKLRSGWDFLRLSIMSELVFCKFQNPLLAEKLLHTGERKLIEGNTWGDKFWGVCQGEGENHLGKILMDVRQNIREVRALV